MNTTQSTPNATKITASDAYVPGVCNINTTEIAYRRKSAYVLLAITLVMTALIFALNLPNAVRIILFAPIFLTVVCYLQVRYKFCVGYGAAGKQNATEGDKEAQDIVDAAAKKLDQDRTRKIKLQAAGIAALVTILLVLVP